jgi:hypothetical protein
MSTTHSFFDPFGAFAADEAALCATATSRPALSYPALLGEAWWDLPAATRDRFAHHDALYTGTMKLHASRTGRWVARLCSLIGSPLPPAHERPIPTTVRVEPDRATGGSRWTRSYAFPTKLTTVASVKALDVDGALVERLSFGLRMRLALLVRDGELCFDSMGYYVECPGLTWHGHST